MPIVWRRPLGGPTPMGVPGAISRMVASPIAPPHVAEHLCGAQGLPAAERIVGPSSPRATAGGNCHTVSMGSAYGDDGTA